MIHTIELIHKIPYIHVQQVLQCVAFADKDMDPDRNYRWLTGRLRKGEHAANGEIDAFVQDMGCWVNLDDFDTATKSSHDARNIGNGINGFKIVRNCNVRQTDEEKTTGILECDFYIIIRLNLRTMMNHRDVYTVRLYRALPGNNEIVEMNFYHRMKELLSPATNLEYLYDFQTWSCHRIDYSCNMKFDTAEQFDLFKKLTHKTSNLNRTEEIKDNDIWSYKQSAAEGNKSYKALFYDKHAECEKHYKGISKEAYSRLLGEAENVVRFEMQCKSGKIKSIMKAYEFPDRMAWRFLREDIAVDVLLDRYGKMVNEGDFYNRWRARSIIRRNVKSQAMQEKLIQFTQMLAEKRHMSRAKEFFTTLTSNHNKFPLAHGTIHTFRARVKKLAELGINPMMIPDACPIKYMKNPKNFIIECESTIEGGDSRVENDSNGKGGGTDPSV